MVATVSCVEGLVATEAKLARYFGGTYVELI